jgi:hypothetical protein
MSEHVRMHVFRQAQLALPAFKAQLNRSTGDSVPSLADEQRLLSGVRVARSQDQPALDGLASALTDR